MSDKNVLSDGNRIATYDEVVEFLRARSDKPCPSCGYTKWSVFTTQEREDSHLGFGLVGLQLHTASILTQGAPLVLTTCRKCAYVKMHSLIEISKWVANGMQEFVDEE